MNARNENTRLSAGSSEGMVLATPDLRGNRFGGTVLPKHLPSLRHEGACIKQIPSKPCYQWPQPLALWRVSRDWVQELLPWKTLWSGRTGRLCTRPNRAAAHPSTDTHTGRHEKTGLRAPESHQEPSNREGVVSGGGALSERAEGRQRGGNATLVR